MAQSVLITLTIAGSDTGPFDLYSDADGYSVPFEINISKALLLAGYLSTSVPNAATIVQLRSKGLCTNSILLPITGSSVTTTTTSTSSSTSTSSTSTSSTSTTTLSACNCYQIQDAEGPGGASGSYTDCDGNSGIWIIPTELGTTYICTRDADSIITTDVVQINYISPSSEFYINCSCSG